MMGERRVMQEALFYGFQPRAAASPMVICCAVQDRLVRMESNRGIWAHTISVVRASLD